MSFAQSSQALLVLGDAALEYVAHSLKLYLVRCVAFILEFLDRVSKSARKLLLQSCVNIRERFKIAVDVVPITPLAEKILDRSLRFIGWQNGPVRQRGYAVG